MVKYLKQNDKSYAFCDYGDAEYAMIPISEFKGYRNALRIIKDRALQQIDKSKADEDGYRLLRVEKTYSAEYKGFLWLVTQETPYSSKIDYSTAKMMITDYLKCKYVWIENIDLQEYTDEPIMHDFKRNITGEIVVKLLKEVSKNYHKDHDFLALGNSPEGRALKSCWDEDNQWVIGIKKLSINYAQGTYEVSYWMSNV